MVFNKLVFLGNRLGRGYMDEWLRRGFRGISPERSLFSRRTLYWGRPSSSTYNILY